MGIIFKVLLIGQLKLKPLFEQIPVDGCLRSKRRSSEWKLDRNDHPQKLEPDRSEKGPRLCIIPIVIPTSYQQPHQRVSHIRKLVDFIYVSELQICQHLIKYVGRKRIKIKQINKTRLSKYIKEFWNMCLEMIFVNFFRRIRNLKSSAML